MTAPGLGPSEDEARWGSEPFSPAEDTTSATVFSCPLCGGRFRHGERVCAACPLNAGCDIVRCPNCGYAFPRTSLLVEWLRRTIGRLGRHLR